MKQWALGLGGAGLLAVGVGLGFWLDQPETGSAEDGALSSPATVERTQERPDPIRPSQTVPDGQLAYLGLATFRDDDQSTACLRFSERPDPDRVVSDKAFIRLTPDAPFSLQVRDQSLCLIGLDDETERTVAVLPGFQSEGGAELQSMVVETIAFEAKPAMVGFVGDGIILPRSDQSVLGLKAMNADAIDLTLYRVNHRALFEQTPDAGETTVEGDWSWNNAAWQSRVEIHSDRIPTTGDVNELVEVGYPLEPIIADLGAGAFIVEIERATDGDSNRVASSWRWLYVTDLALASYRTEEAMHVTVRSIETAKTVGDVNLTLIARNNEVLAEVQSDPSGHAKFPAAALRGTGNLAPKMIMAYAGEDDFAVLDLSRSPLDLTAYDVTGRQASGPIDAYMFTERGVYRPGETVHLTSLIRDANARAAFDRSGTLTVRRPDGTEFSEARISPDGQAGALYRQIRLPENAARGRWTVELALDGLESVGSTRFSVEDFIPEQLRLDLRADDAPIRLGEPRSLTVAADFLYGAPGRGLEAEAEARVSVDPSPFAEWKDYRFGNATETYREQLVPIGQGVTNDQGLFTTQFDLAGEAYQSSSPLRLFVTAGVAEPSGRYVRDSLFLPLRSEAAYVGFDPVFDGGYAKRNTPAEIRLIAVDATGERIALDGTLSLIREDYDYHWYREDGRWRYRRDRRDIRLDETAVSLSADEPYLFSEPLDYGEYRVEFVSEDGAIFSYQFGSGWRRAGGDADAPDRIEMGLSQATVSPGETIALSVNAPFGGVGELVIADRGVKSVQTIQIDEGQSDIRLPIAKGWTSDLYAMLTVYTPGAEDRPRRAVGLVHIPMDRSSQTINVSLEMPNQIRPRSTQHVTVKMAGLDGEQAFLTLAAVDTGILQITDFTPPDPEAHFFGKLAFPLDVFDDYARMLAPFSGVDRVGGDTLGGAGLSVVPTTIVSLFEGPVRVSGGEATVTLDIPDFQGELSVMAVAWTETKVGSASAPMIVRDPVTAQLALPRFLAPGDRAVANVALDNVDGESGTYVTTVSIDGSDVEQFEQTLSQGDRSETGVEITAGPPGISTYSLALSGPDTDLTRDYQLQTRIPNRPVTRTRFVKLEPNQSMSLNLAEDKAGLMVSSIEQSITASFTPGLTAQPLLASLQRYPYGCTEQTVSVAQPLLMVGAFGGLPGMDETARLATLQAAVDKLLGRQDANGAFGLWGQGDGQASPYLQLYTSDFILQAEAEGLRVPAAAKRRTLSAIRALTQLDQRTNLSLDYNFGMDDQSPDYELRAAERAAYAQALLARHDTVKKSDLLYLDRRFGERLRPSIAQSHLGYALQAVGEEARAANAFARAANRISEPGQTYYDSDLRNAAALMVLADDLPEETVTQAMLTLQVDRPEQLNTHEKAWLLRLLADQRMSGTPFEGSENWRIRGNSAVQQVAASEDSLTIDNSESSPVWLQVTTEGIPDGPMTAMSQGASLAKAMFDMDGNRVTEDQITRGERFVIRLEARAASRNDAMWVISDLLPAGVEIETILTSADAGDTGPFGWLGELTDVDMTEARDDRFVASWRTQSRSSDQTRRLAYVVRATTRGDFVFPGAHLEDMYRPERMASTASGRLAVTPPPTL